MTQTVTITLAQDEHGNLSAATDLAAPRVGAPVTPVQALALQLISQLQRNAATPISHNARNVPALGFVLDLMSPEQYGWLVPMDIRQQALLVLRRTQLFGELAR